VKNEWVNNNRKSPKHDYTQYQNVQFGNHFRDKILNDINSFSEHTFRENNQSANTHSEIELPTIDNRERVSLPRIDSSEDFELMSNKNIITRPSNDAYKITLPVIDET